MIQGTTLRDAILSASAEMNRRKQEVDALNVFPVPDGDTGTNMSMTIGNAARELSRLDHPTVAQTASVASGALLRGARGNSGVILSLLFRGMAKGLKGKEQAGGADLARSLGLGVEAAYKAVMKPTEGTILTVAREAAARGKAVAEKDDDVLSVWGAMCDQAEETLKHTPELLPMLKKAGVVDAGGQGLCIIMQAMREVFAGGVVPKTESIPAPAAEKPSAAGAFEGEITYTYCTEFIVSRVGHTDADPLALRAYLESVGDCVVVVDDEDIIKVHVHTNDPGLVLHEALAYGNFETVKVENMRIQHQNAGWVNEAGSPEFQRAEPKEGAGFVAVAAGEGVVALFHDLGCHHVVSGGQTMNPSTDDILRAIEATPAKVVYVLPNNKNIILAAEQAVPLADREVHVLPTCTVVQGISALLGYDPEKNVEENLLTMTKAADNVSTGQITYAARDSEFDGHHIDEGTILALENGKIAFLDNDLSHAALKLVRHLVAGRRETSFITLIYGEGVSEEEAQALSDAVSEKFAGAFDITVVNGGQPVYYYMISAE